MAKAWRLDQLPANYQTELADLARSQGCRSAAELLQTAVKRWQPENPIGQIAQHCIDQAFKLREALKLSLLRRDNPNIPSSDLERHGLAEYHRVFGYRVSARHWRGLVSRTIERDRGFEEWDRIELYLHDRLQRLQAPSTAPEAAPGQFVDLVNVIALFKDPTCPSSHDKACLLLKAFQWLEEAGPQCVRERKPALLGFLQRHARFLGPTPEAVRRTVDRKLNLWRKAGRSVAALLDQRPAANAKRRFTPSRQDADELIGRSVLFHESVVAPAWRKAIVERALSPDLRERYAVPAGRKSRVPKRIMRAVRHEVTMLRNHHLGPKQARLHGAYIGRDWTRVHAGDWHQADDVTPDLYYWIPTEDGWFQLLRGQFLLTIDLRSKYILDFLLIDSKGYTAGAIRTLMNRTCLKYRLPRHGWYFERGIWENSHLVKSIAGAAAGWNEVECGLARLEPPLKIVHAKKATSKPIENAIGLLEKRLAGEPGYVGRDEMHQKYERVRAAILDVEARRRHPSDAGFYSADQWFKRLHEIAAEYNAEPQESKMTLGLSPEQAWAQFQDPNNPPVELPQSLQFLFAPDRRRVKVTANGVPVHAGSTMGPIWYKNDATGALIGEEVNVAFDPGNIDSVIVTDMNNENPVFVPRDVSPGAMDAAVDPGHSQDLATALARVASQNRYAKVRYAELRAKFLPPARRVLVDAETAGLARSIQEQGAAITESRQRACVEAKNRERFARQIGGNSRAVFAGTLPPSEDLRELREFLSDPAPES